MQKLEYLCNNHQQRENKIQSLQEIEQTDSVPILTIDFMNRCPSPAPLEARTPEQTEPAFCHFRIGWIIAAPSYQQFWYKAVKGEPRHDYQPSLTQVTLPQAWDTSPVLHQQQQS